MSGDVAVIAFGALSGLGRGAAAASAGEVGEPARIATVDDEELRAAGLARPFASRVPLPSEPGRDRATTLLVAALEDALLALDLALPAWRDRRVGLALGTSSGGMRTAELLFRALRDQTPVSADLGRRAQYFSPMVDAIAETKLVASPCTLILTACAASTVALGLGRSWLLRGECDVVLAGGFDAVGVFVASGFEALRATTARLPSRPFSCERDGMALGEGAAVLALVRPADARAPLAYVCGFGAAGDAVHVTAPDRTGDGLARAAEGALRGAPPDVVDLVSAHGTATPFNDAAESKAMARVLGARAADVVVHPFKAQIGHTLGAAGALESLAAIDALRRGVLPASVLDGARDPEAPARLLDRSEVGSGTVALKLSAAFGGANAALLLATRPLSTGALPQTDAFVSGVAYADHVPTLPELASLTGQPMEKLARADAPCHLALLALALLRDQGLDLSGAGIVVGHAYATLDVNEQYNRRILERGARLVEPRRFPYTSPNAVAGECSVVFRLTGPNIALGSGLHGGLEAVCIAADLVRAGHADRVVAVAVDAPGIAAQACAEAAGWPLPRAGAVAVLVSRVGEGTSRRIVATTLASSGAPDDVPRAPGHEALLPLLTGAPKRVATASPWGAWASVELESP